MIRIRVSKILELDPKPKKFFESLTEKVLPTDGKFSSTGLKFTFLALSLTFSPFSLQTEEHLLQRTCLALVVWYGMETINTHHELITALRLRENRV